ncbi:MAG: ornithine cyclodeaminase family protein, partial [Woeseiaceae bacterium]
MQILDAAAVAGALPYAELVDTLEEAFRQGATVPRRTHHALDVPGEPQGSLLLMPAWQPGHALGVKIVSVLPGNAKRGIGAVQAAYLLMEATGVPRCLLDGSELTLRRTAAASALASRHLSRKTSRTLLMVGTGRLAPHLVRAHAAVRPIREVLVWGRRERAARDLAHALSGERFHTTVCGELQAAVGRADIISCATLATDPLIMGSWLGPGQHLDLVG